MKIPHFQKCLNINLLNYEQEMIDFFLDFLIPGMIAFGLASCIAIFLVVMGRRKRKNYYENLLQNNNNVNNILGDLAVILRQRYFIDHTPNAQKLIREEYTIQSNENGVVDIVLQFSQFLPNLSVYNSSKNKLVIMTNQYTQALLIGVAKTSPPLIAQKLNSILVQMNNEKTYIIWIKLDKPLNTEETTIIELEYDAQKTDTRDRLLLTVNPVPHNVFYTIKKPEDYTFNKTKIHSLDENGTLETKDSWNKKHQTLMHSNETQDSVTLTSKTGQDKIILLTYSFRPKNEIIALPAAVVVFLSLFGFIIIAFQPCYFDENCVSSLDLGIKSLLDSRLQIAIFLITASLVLPRLVKNDTIRFRISLGIILPVILGIVIFLGLIK